MPTLLNRKILWGIMASTATLPAALGQKEAQKPNIIIIMVDQLRADLMKREGYPLNTMPFADSLARCGTWFNRAIQQLRLVGQLVYQC